MSVLGWMPPQEVKRLLATINQQRKQIDALSKDLAMLKERDALLRQAEAALNEAERQAQESNGLLLTTIEQQSDEIARLQKELDMATVERPTVPARPTRRKAAP